MHATRRAALAAPVIVLAAARAAVAQVGTITGTATYRERIALPPGAVLEVELRDTARADPQGSVLATARATPAAQVPIAFALRFDRARIDPRGTYGVAARLVVGDAVWFRSDRAVAVLTGGAGDTADLLLVREVAAAPPALTGAPWVAREIAGRPSTGTARPDITFDGQGRAYGTGGCNRFTGGYVLEGAALRFGQTAQTSMACAPPAMEQEARFHDALAAVRGWRIDGGHLVLLDGGGAVRMRLARRG